MSIFQANSSPLDEKDLHYSRHLLYLESTDASSTNLVSIQQIFHCMVYPGVKISSWLRAKELLKKLFPFAYITIKSARQNTTEKPLPG